MIETENNDTPDEIEEVAELEDVGELEEIEDGLEVEPELEVLDGSLEPESEFQYVTPEPNWPLILVLLFIVAFGIGIGSGYLIWGRETGEIALVENTAEADEQTEEQARDEPVSAEAPAEAPVEEPAYSIPENIQRYEVLEGDNPVWGSDNAPITIIEFSDYECPFCTKWHLQVWPLIQANYGDRVRLVYRDFPLVNIHSNATPAAAAANCAREQDKYWEFNEFLFTGEYSLNEDAYRSLADELGLEMEAFNECLESKRYNAEVQADLDYAVSIGVQSTPTFFINGLAVVGAQPYDLFEFIIEKELAGEIP